MNAISNMAQYAQYVKPVWAPPGWLFPPVWAVLYILIALSFGYVIYQHTQKKLALKTVTPFVVNLLFNFLYMPIMFYTGDMILATFDVLVVLATLIWAIIAIWHKHRWVAYANFPYLAWVIYAALLQISILYLNTPCKLPPGYAVS